MSRVTKAALGPLAQAAGLDEATPQGRFRRTLRLAIPSGGAAQGARLAQAPVLEVTFLTREVEATAPGAPEPAALSVGSDGLVLSLGVAREIARIRLTTPQASDQIACFRFDGDTVADDPVAAPTHGGAGASLDVTARELILRRRNAGDHALTAADIAGVVLRYAPVNPRLLVAVVGDPAGEQALAPVTGPGGEPVFPAAMSRGDSLAKVLAPALGRLAAAGPLPDPIELDLILEADQPCAARIDALDLRLLLERRGFAGEPGKRVLRFQGGSRETQSVELALPPVARTLEGTMSFAVAAGPAKARTGALSDPAPASGPDGVALGRGDIIAGRIDLAAPAVVVGAEIVVAAVEPQTVVVTTLRADGEGRPGVVLAAGAELALKGAGPQAVAVAWPPTAVPAGPVWLALAAPRGAAVAMLGEDDGGSVVRGSGPDFAALGPVATALAAVLRLAAPVQSQQAEVLLRLGGQTLTAVAGTADLTDALASLPDPRPASLALSVSAGIRAIVTLDPPVLHYTLTE